MMDYSRRKSWLAESKEDWRALNMNSVPFNLEHTLVALGVFAIMFGIACLCFWG
jgi:hypothetical protein